MNETPPPSDRDLLLTIRRRLGMLSVTVCVLILAVLLEASAVYGSLINYFAGDAQLYVAATIGAAAIGFILGWIARSRL